MKFAIILTLLTAPAVLAMNSYDLDLDTGRAISTKNLKSKNKCAKKSSNKNILLTFENAAILKNSNISLINTKEVAKNLKRKNDQQEDISQVVSKKVKAKSIKILPFRQIRT